MTVQTVEVNEPGDEGDRLIIGHWSRFDGLGYCMIIHKALMLHGSTSRVGSGAMLASGRGGGTSDRSATGASGIMIEL